MHVLILNQVFETYGTERLVQALKARKHTVKLLRPLDCTVHVGDVGGGVIYEGQRVDDADAVLLRCAAYTRYGLTIVRTFESAVATQLESAGLICINQPQAKLHAHDKFLSMQLLQRAGIPIPLSVLTWDPASLEQAVSEYLDTPVILKTRQGSLGIGVMRADTVESALAIHDTMRTVERILIAQQYLVEGDGQDIRVIVLGNEVLGAFRRTARPGEFRANIHRGGTAEIIELPEGYAQMAVRAAKALELDLAGVDIIETERGPVVLEVNPSAGWQQLEKHSDIDVATRIVAYLEGKVAV
ncbi:MAG: RimK family alpha-L-glutamate ligase [Chloroflexota bacterium]|nr:RimK family alpha-L-glutamate ligase [Chloroflexota bacterium]